MKLVCKYCGYVVEYDNGHGWFPGYVTKMYNHIFGKHVKIEQLVDPFSDTITYRACIVPGYSEEMDPIANKMLTVTQENRIHPPAYIKPKLVESDE